MAIDNQTSAYQNFKVHSDARGVTTVALDVPGRPLNVLDDGVIRELEAIIELLELHAEPHRLVVFRSDKESGFLAGADVQRIGEIRSHDEARELIRRGQQLFARIERLPMPTLAVIHGPCLGGGLEWAMSCTCRAARGDEATQIGLPEIKLGLIPAWGGTQRLPRLVGLQKAIEMILKGRTLGAVEAERAGLVDSTLSPGGWDEELGRLVDRMLDDAKSSAGDALRRTARGGLWQRMLEGTRIGRAAIFYAVRYRTARERRHYPAIEAALDAIAAGFDDRVDGFAVECDSFAQLIVTPTARNLIDLFFAREAARKPRTWISDESLAAHAPPIRKVGIVGAGVMGSGIAQLAAVRGFDVAIREIDDESAAAGKKRIEELVAGQAKRKRWTAEKAAEVTGRVRVGTDFADLADADLVIEAAVEKESVKHEVFRSLDAAVRPSAVLASNTSSLSIASMAGVTQRGAKVAGLHFFNPVYRMELVEVVAAPQTDAETIARLVAWVRALGKTPIVANDSPGIVVNRVLFPYLGEAVRMISDGYDTREIDNELKNFGMPMGPLELLDQVGIDVALHVAGSLRNILGEAEAVAGPLAKMAEHDRLGKKSGIGFYRYRGGRRHRAAPLPEGVRKSPSPVIVEGAAGNFADDSMTPIQRRLVYPMLIEAVRCLELRIARSAWSVDLAMVLGTGFAPYRGGPLHMIDAIGADRVVENLNRLRARHGERFAPPTLLVEAGRGVERLVDWEAKDHELKA